jgi:hypothetical protein
MNESIVNIKDVEYYKVFSAPRDMESLKGQVGSLFSIRFLSLVNLKTDEHYIIPHIVQNDHHENIGIQKMNSGNPLWEDSQAFLQKAMDGELLDDELELGLILMTG